MVERHAAGAAHAGHRALDFAPDEVGVDQAGEAAVLAVMVPTSPVCVPGVTSIGPLDRSVVVEQHADGEDVVIGVRVERPVLVPFHRRAIMRRLHVELGAVQPEARADQLVEDVEHRPASHDLVEQRMDLVRRLDAADAGVLGGVARLEVVDGGMFRLAARRPARPSPRAAAASVSAPSTSGTTIRPSR